MTKWKKVIGYFNSMSKDGVVSREDFFSAMGVEGVKTASEDSYRSLLCALGYLEPAGVAMYRKVADIPEGLTSFQATDAVRKGEKLAQMEPIIPTEEDRYRAMVRPGMRIYGRCRGLFREPVGEVEDKTVVVVAEDEVKVRLALSGDERWSRVIDGKEYTWKGLVEDSNAALAAWLEGAKPEGEEA